MHHSPNEIRSINILGVSVLAALLLASLSARAQPQESSSKPAVAPAGNAENGKKLYNRIGCWQCHGFSGQGGSAGPRIATNLMPLPAFTKFVRAPRLEMPPYTSKVLSDAQLADIHAFLTTLPKPRDAKDIPLLNQKEESKPPAGAAPIE